MAARAATEAAVVVLERMHERFLKADFAAAPTDTLRTRRHLATGRINLARMIGDHGMLVAEHKALVALAEKDFEKYRIARDDGFATASECAARERRLVQEKRLLEEALKEKLRPVGLDLNAPIAAVVPLAGRRRHPTS